MKFTIGQRWASRPEPHLGLGIVVEYEWRRVTVSFPAAEEIRTYATDTAPLARIIYSAGDTITDHDQQQYQVINVRMQQELAIYVCQDAQGTKLDISELKLNCQVEFTTPQQRLFSSQFDSLKGYRLRVASMAQLQRLQQSSVRGLLGARTSLLPHQVYIAHQVAERHAPRVLLADEVGLGKTIEAGMILHQQLQSGRISRVLILVPESLLHQWLVEMLRRFNLSFALFDESRLEAMSEDEQQNPFETEQRVLCNLQLLAANPQIQAQAVAANWDLVIVDEAHHLHWSPQHSSAEYQCVEQLAQNAAGLLLLTATPEQIGIEGHYARLRLLDPARFHDLQSFKTEAAGYEKLNALLTALQTGELDQAQQQTLSNYLDHTAIEQLDSDAGRDHIVQQLLDRHGTGRVLFRNTRAAVRGFPERHVHSYPLACNDNYPENKTHLFPEQDYSEEEWSKLDPRVEWLTQHLKQLKTEKVLVICHFAATACALDKFLNLRAGIRCTSFYEGLSLLERDRAAAYFAESEAGAQVLVCSEIGSEGRNFQFAQHLVLFDLPMNPDLIEQRIGRLDRIGQQAHIHIHVPYLENTAQQRLFAWYHQGLNLFTQSCAAGFAIYEKFAAELQPLLHDCTEDMTALIAATADYTEAVRQAQQLGRDRLLELNSCRPQQAAVYIDAIEQEERNDELQHYMDLVFDYYGVEQEYHSADSIILRPSDNMHTDYFPGLPADGITATYSRTKALQREDMEFLTWEHPMVAECMEMILSGDAGNAVVATMSSKVVPRGSLLLETWFSVQISAPRALQLDRYLSINPLRLLLNQHGESCGELISSEQLLEITEPLKQDIAHAVITQVRDAIEDLLQQASRQAEAYLEKLKPQAAKKIDQLLGGELQRLRDLHQQNPSIRPAEIMAAEQQLAACHAQLAHAKIRLEAVQVLINN